jgi:hypothetical protein
MGRVGCIDKRLVTGARLFVPTHSSGHVADSADALDH